MQIEAAFDCLTILALLQDVGVAPTKGEVHLLAYLGWSLSVYAQRGEGASDWGYGFAATPGGSPFSEELQIEIEELIASGVVSGGRTTLQLTTEGISLQQRLGALGLVRERLNFLDGAVATTLAMPLGMMRTAFAHGREPSLVAKHKRTRILVSESALACLYAEFNAVADVLGTAHHSLLAASVLWLTGLAELETTAATS